MSQFPLASYRAKGGGGAQRVLRKFVRSLGEARATPPEFFLSRLDTSRRFVRKARKTRVARALCRARRVSRGTLATGSVKNLTDAYTSARCVVIRYRRSLCARRNGKINATSPLARTGFFFSQCHRELSTLMAQSLFTDECRQKRLARTNRVVAQLNRFSSSRV